MNQLAKERGSATESLVNLIGASVRESPRVTAVEADCGSITYGELDRRANLLAGALRTNGVGKGSLVAVCLPRSIDQIVALFAVWKSGAAYLPLDTHWPEARLALLVERAQCDAVIVASSHAPLIFGNVPVLDSAAEGNNIAEEEPSASDLAYVIFTSGSTGEPKGVEVTHGNLTALATWHCQAFAVQAGTRTSHLAGLGFDAAAWEVWPTLAAGGTLCIAGEETRLDPRALRDWLVKERVDVSFAPTALAAPLVQMDWPETAALRVLLTGADRLTVRPKPGLPFAFINNYGPTECTVVATSGVVDADGEGLPTIGKAITSTIIHLLDPTGGTVLHGMVGEIHIGGAQVGRGYHGDAALTAERFFVHPEHGRLYRTGDLASWQENGELNFIGRVDAQVKIRGQRVEPAEVSAALGHLAKVQACHVAVRDGELVAYVVPSTGASPTAGALRAALAETLPDFMIPARFAQLDKLPITANGKLDVNGLCDPAKAPMPEAAQRRLPATPTEQRLFNIVSEILGNNALGTDDDFFLVGGHSLLGTQVIVHARNAFGVELGLFDLFEAPTVEKLARKVEELVFAKIAAMSDDDVRRMAG